MNTFTRSLLLTLALLAAALLLPGCVQTAFEVKPDGTYTFYTLRGAFTGRIGAVEVTRPDGTKFKLTGYQSEADGTIESVAAGVARGLTP